MAGRIAGAATVLGDRCHLVGHIYVDPRHDGGQRGVANDGK